MSAFNKPEQLGTIKPYLPIIIGTEETATVPDSLEIAEALKSVAADEGVIVTDDPQILVKHLASFLDDAKKRGKFNKKWEGQLPLMEKSIERPELKGLSLIPPFGNHIWIRSGLPTGEHHRTLFHEVGHIIAPDELNFLPTQHLVEIYADTFSFVLASRLGYDFSPYVRRYIQDLCSPFDFLDFLAIYGKHLEIRTLQIAQEILDKIG